MKKIILFLLVGFLSYFDNSFANNVCEYHNLEKSYNSIKAYSDDQGIVFIGKNLSGENIYIGDDAIPTTHKSIIYRGNGILEIEHANGLKSWRTKHSNSVYFKNIQAFQPGTHTAVIVMPSGKEALMKDGRIVSKEYFKIKEFSISADQKHFAFIAEEQNPYKTILVVNGRENKKYTSVHQLQYTGSKLSFIAQKESGTEVLIQNGKIIYDTSNYDFDSSIKLTSEGEGDFSYVIQEKGILKIVLNKKKSNKQEFSNIHNISHFPNGKYLIYGTQTNGKAIIEFDGNKFTKYDYISSIVFSKDYTKFAFIGKIGKESFMVVNGTQYKTPYYSIHSGQFSPDGKKFAFVGGLTSSSRTLVENGKQIGNHDDVHAIGYTNDSKLVAEVKKNGKTVIIKGNKVISVEGHALDFIIPKEGSGLIFTKRVFTQEGIKESIVIEECKEDSGNKTSVLSELENSLNKKTHAMLNSPFKKYVQKLNTIIPKLQMSQLQRGQAKLNKINPNDYKKMKIFIEYLQAKVNLEVYLKQQH